MLHFNISLDFYLSPDTLNVSEFYSQNFRAPGADGGEEGLANFAWKEVDTCTHLEGAQTPTGEGGTQKQSGRNTKMYFEGGPKKSKFVKQYSSPTSNVSVYYSCENAFMNKLEGKIYFKMVT